MELIMKKWNGFIKKSKGNPSLKSIHPFIHPVWKGRMDSEETGQVHTPHMDGIMKLPKVDRLGYAPPYAPYGRGVWIHRHTFLTFFPIFNLCITCIYI